MWPAIPLCEGYVNLVPVWLQEHPAHVRGGHSRVREHVLHHQEDPLTFGSDRAEQEHGYCEREGKGVATTINPA